MGSIFKPQSSVVPSNSSGETKYEIPEYFKKAQEALFKRAEAESQRPYESYSGKRIADFTKGQKDAQAAAEQNLGAFAKSGATKEARGMLDQMKAVGEERFEGSTVDQYMNPYIQNVVDRSMASLGEIAGQQRGQRAATQISANSYGGSRAAIENALAQEREMKQAGDLTAQLMASGFESGRGAFQQDRNTRMNNLGQLASAIPALQLQKQGTAMNEAQAAMQYGGQEQALEQANLNELYKDFIEKQGFGRGQLGFLSQILGAAPIRSYGQSSTGMQENVIGGTSPFAQIAGAMMAGMKL